MPLSDRDLDLLSAYLDNALSDEERAAAESRLAADADLRRELERLRLTKSLIGALPMLRPPRPLTVTRAMIAPPRVLLFPATVAFSALSAAAAIVILLAGVLLLSTGRGDSPLAVANMPTDSAMLSQRLATAEAEVQAEEAAQTEPMEQAVEAPPSDDQAGDAGLAGGAMRAQESPTPMGTLAPTVIDPGAFSLAAPTETLDAANIMPFAAMPTSDPLGDALGDAAARSLETPTPAALLELAPMAAAAVTDTPSPTMPPTATAAPTRTATPTPAPTETPTLEPTITPPAPAAQSGDGSSIGVALIVLAALLFLLSATAFMRRAG